MIWQEGMRVRVTEDVWGNKATDNPVNIKGMTGVIIEKRNKIKDTWYVKMDNHPGFKNQNGCWSIREHQMINISLTNNREASILLSQDEPI